MFYLIIHGGIGIKSSLYLISVLKEDIVVSKIVGNYSLRVYKKDNVYYFKTTHVYIEFMQVSANRNDGAYLLTKENVPDDAIGISIL